MTFWTRFDPVHESTEVSVNSAKIDSMEMVLNDEKTNEDNEKDENKSKIEEADVDVESKKCNFIVMLF